MAEQRLEEIRKARLQKVEELRKKGINPYVSKPKGDFIPVEKARASMGKEVSVVGRLLGKREHGNCCFSDIQDETASIQLFYQKEKLDEDYELLSYLDIGDFVWVKGKVIETSAGETSIDIDEFQLLTKSIRPLPSTWYGLKDVEERYRKRYLDLLFNPEVRERFNIRTKMMREIRNYLDDLGFWEVETPTLQPLYGGANAKPFKTHLNAQDREVYLRIADELYLKRLVVGGYDKVYEICKDFRNEGIDHSHNPEFTMIEYYEAYADYHRVMDVTEGLFKHLADKLFGKTDLKVDEKTIDIGKKWPRVTMVDSLKEHLDLDVMKMEEKELADYAKEHNIEVVGGETKGQLIFTIYEHLVTPKLIDPIWIIDYPRDVSPLSKHIEGNEDWVERFEGYIGGKEICDGWSELTDPIEQRERFEKDTEVARKDHEEAQHVDDDFIEAMEYGMPPIGGIGIGIDRLTMFFTNTWSIKEVILYPLMRPETKEEENNE